jgi:antitoxin component of RelBE/YafQ-DinJ toxin-antitoxin module
MKCGAIYELEELIQAIVEVAQNTGLPLRQCITEAKKMLRQQMKEHYKQQTKVKKIPSLLG